MPTNVRIIQAHDFITATAQGTFAFEESKKVLIDIAAAAGPLTSYEILLDTRHAHSHLSMTELWYLAAELAKLGSTFRRKTAVLCPLARLDHAEFFALCAENRGLLVRGFTSFEEALLWLTETPDNSPEASTLISVACTADDAVVCDKDGGRRA